MKCSQTDIIDQRIERVKARLKRLRAERRLSVYLERERRAAGPVNAATPTAPLPVDAHTDTARQGEPESIGEILPRVLADLDPDRRRRKPMPHELALLDDDVRELAPDAEGDE